MPLLSRVSRQPCRGLCAQLMRVPYRCSLRLALRPPPLLLLLWFPLRALTVVAADASPEQPKSVAAVVPTAATTTACDCFSTAPACTTVVSCNGSFPTTLGTDLPALTNITLVDTTVRGTLPPSLASLTALSVLDVRHGALSGSVPAFLSSLRSLQSLRLSYIPMFGSLPSSLGMNQPSLTSLWLWEVPLSGTLPQSLGSARAMKELYLAVDGLTGPLPTGVGSLKELTNLVLITPRLSGSLPAGLASLHAVQSLLLMAMESLTGTLPKDLGRDMPGLAQLQFDFLPGLSGSLPDVLSGSPEFVVFANTGLEGTVPAGLLPQNSGAYYGQALQELNIGDNVLSGPFHTTCEAGSAGFPSDLAVRQLCASGNALTHLDLSGWMACQYGRPTALTNLDLHGNPDMRGQLPTSLAAYSSLQSLDVSGCALSGTIPSLTVDAASVAGVGAGTGDAVLPPLAVLNLRGNAFSGLLPSALGQLSALRVLDVSDNALDPTMPASICSLDVDNFTACNVSGQTPVSPDSGATGEAGGWDCSALLTSCARRLQRACGAGDRCVQTSHVLAPGVIAAVIVLAVAMAVAVPVAVVVAARRRRAQAALAASLEQRRAATVELLQGLVVDEDVVDVMLPADSVDFGPDSKSIGSGGGGCVYRGTLALPATRLTVILEAVALKEIHEMRDLVTFHEGVRDFAKELAVLMKLRHDHIVAFYGMYQYFDVRGSTVTDRYFLVTQFADHGSLDRYIEEPFSADWSLQRRLAWARQIALAVLYIHRENFVHRDLKPQNVLLHGDDWHCLLTDFGIARSLSEDRTLTSKIGTAQFMPPEALSGLADASADVEMPEPPTLQLAKAWDTYSFGCLIATIFNRTVLPYPDLDERVVMVGVLLNGLRPEVPGVLSTGLQELVQAMWHTDPAARPDLAAVLDALDAAEAEGPFAE